MEEFEIPADLTTLSDDDLASFSERAVEAFDAVYGEGDAADPDKLSALAGAITAAKAEGDARRAARAEAKRLADELHAQVHASDGEGDEAEGEEAEGEGDAGEAPAPVEVEGDESDAEVEAAAPMAVAASARKIVVPAARVREQLADGGQSNTQPATPAAPTVVITAAAGVPGVPGGAVLDRGDIGDAMHRVARGLAVGHGNGRQEPVASINLPDTEYVLSSDAPGRANAEVLQAVTAAAAEAARDPFAPHAVTAAGGWCVPSMPILDLFSVEATDGLFDAPTVRIDGGGVELPVSPSLADVYADPDGPWQWTETQDEDVDPDDPTTWKPCIRVPCPDFDDVRMRYDGLCVTAGNLTDASWPQLTRRFVDLVMAAHLHYISLRQIQQIIANAKTVPVTTLTGDVGALWPILGALELQVADLNDKYGASDNQVYEVKLPRWVRRAIRNDLAARQGVEAFAITNAQIDGFFRERNLMPQWLSDFDKLGDPTPGNEALSWNTNVRALLYTPGTVVIGTGKTIDLGVTRDTTVNAQNDHSAAFTEQGSVILVPGHEVRLVSIDICVNGSTNPGDPDDYVCTAGSGIDVDVIA